jgi:hypothetical protein
LAFSAWASAIDSTRVDCAATGAAIDNKTMSA